MGCDGTRGKGVGGGGGLGKWTGGFPIRGPRMDLAPKTGTRGSAMQQLHCTFFLLSERIN